jgi:hypothetical protein
MGSVKLSKKPLNTYLGEIELRKRDFIIVEGSSDKKVLDSLIRRLCQFHSKCYCSILVDSVANLDVTGVIGNRAQVIATCSFVLDNIKNKSIKFVGFVDREFDNFDLGNLQDLQNEHYVDQERYLVYSRGHSIENYLFDFLLFKELLCSIFNAKSACEILQVLEVNQILEEFEAVFHEIINVACAIGLAAYDLKMLTPIQKNLTLEENIALDTLKFESGKPSIDFEKLKDKLLIEKGVDASKLECLVEKYNSYLNKLVNIELSVVRRLCHGHLGFNLILFACCCCFKRITRLEQNSLKSLIGRVRGLSSEGGRAFEQFVIEWSRKVQEQGYEYPKELFLFLGIPNECIEHAAQ